MKLFIFLVLTITTTLGYNRPHRDIYEASGNLRNSYDSDNVAYLAPYATSREFINSYEYPKPEVEVLPPKINRLYLPVEPVYPSRYYPSRTNFEAPLQTLPSENRPKYVGTGNYIFEIQADEDSHRVDVENPFFKNTIHFVE